ncbi:MAG: cytosine permease, partial [Chloroflexota bacterium]|nr:cytosine permease [Chloroflexota bacterium]
VAPRHIDFKRGGLIAAVVALIITPWNLFNNPDIINYFLGGLGALLGPLFGIIMIDYYVLRKQQVNVADLFRERGQYYYRRGWNPIAVVSFLVSATPAIILALVPAFGFWAPFSWFIGAALGAVVHHVLTARRGVAVPAPAGDLEGSVRHGL